jgi:hypothetical protein
MPLKHRGYGARYGHCAGGVSGLQWPALAVSVDLVSEGDASFGGVLQIEVGPRQSEQL